MVPTCRKPPGGNGHDAEAVGPSLTLETSVDLDGRASPERLMLDGRTLVVGNGCPEKQRRWPLERLDGFRIQPTIGSCFLQGQVAGRWIDLLRRPGKVDATLSETVARLNSQRRVVAAGAPNGDSAARLGVELKETVAGPQPVRLLSLLRPFSSSVLLLLCLSAAIVGIEVIPPLLQRMLVDRVLTADVVKHPSAELLFLLLAIVTGLLLVRVASMLVTVWKGCVSSRVGTAMTANLRDALVEKLNALPLAFHDRNQVGVLMSQVAYDTETLHTLIYHMTSGLLLQSLQLMGISVALFYLNPKLAVITLLPMPLILAGSWYFTRYLQPRQHHYWEAVGKQATALMGMLSGIRVVKSFVQEEQEVRRFRASSRRLRDSRRTVDISTSAFTAMMGLLFAIGGLAVWYVGGRDVLSGQMTLGSLMAFLAYLAMFYAPLTSIAESTAWFANFFGTSRRICDVLKTPNENHTCESPEPLARAAGRIDVEHLSFGYDKSRPVLTNVSFSVRPGELLGIVGRSGSGKSTLVSLLGRLYEPDSGRICLDGIDVRQLSPKDLRRQIGMVPQDPFLFRGTVAENIAYGNAEATPEQILLAAIEADAHDFVMEMPLAYSTQLREGGLGLSGGQRQRLSIARALLFNPPVLILDEATSNIDAESERAICNTLRRWTRRRTAIVISHRLSTLGGANRLLVFDQGQLIEQGTPDELLARGGVYSRLANLQWRLSDLQRRLEATVAASRLGPHLAEGEPSASHAAASDPAHDDAASETAIPWLDPRTTHIANDGQGWLRVTTEQATADGVYAACAFPTGYQREYVCLRCRQPSGRERELGIVESLRHWPPDARQAIEQSLGRHYLLRRVREIRQMRASENVLTLEVATDGGLASLRLDKPGEGAQPFGSDGLLLADAGGNYFVIPDRGTLPRRQQRLLTLYFGD
ncbi:MAG: DUF1854 domain-containing protein [Thermoguttaceae bacterium]